jgi:Domain of unknown function DUF29
MSDNPECGPQLSEYETDIVAWSEQHAELLRHLAAGERVHDQVDWVNVAEEIESVAHDQIDAVESLWTQSLLHDLRAKAWPRSPEVEKWRADARLLRSQARRKYRPSMRQRIGLAELYADALAGLPDKMDGLAPLPASQTCPVTLDELLADE